MKIIITNSIPSLKAEMECNKSLLDPNEVVSSTLFSQLMHKASIIFMSRLILGGAYEVNRDDKEKILNALIDIERVLEKYE